MLAERQSMQEQENFELALIPIRQIATSNLS
jgi:hypothetical protein